MIRTRRSSLLEALLCLVCVSASLLLSPVQLGAREDPSGDGTQLRAGRYVVRPGDTLRSLAERYLGASERWGELWRLNREKISDPDLLQPGWVLEIYWRSLPERNAVLSNRWNQVESWRPPLSWEEALINDVLARKDRIQTFRSSSAELTFGDGSNLRVSEESLVLLDPTARLGATVEREAVEIVQGQADLGGEALDPSQAGIELVIGDATAAPRPAENGAMRSRVRKVEGAAQLMVYTGDSELEAAGTKVAVAEGMGSSVPEGEAPSPPEALLEAPEKLEPRPAARLATPRPEFRWQPVPNAASYVVEICRDAECSQLQLRTSPTSGERWQPVEQLPATDLHWRGTARSITGLDGYPSAPRAFTVLTGEEDTRPPTVAFRVTPPRLAPRFGLNRNWILGRGARFEAVAEDGESGIEGWTPLIDGEEVSVERWQAGPWGTGEQMAASFVARDRAGNASRLEPVSFVFDDQPPTLSWGQEQVGELGTVGPPATTPDSWPENPSLRVLEVNDPHSIWPWRKQVWQITKDPRQVVVRPKRPVWVRIDGREFRLTPERGVWLLAEDAICDSIFRLEEDLDLRVKGRMFRKRSELTLRVEAWDWVENRAVGELVIETLGRRRPAARDRE
ncbi:MAG: LysM peptidoglycan-binding domain-containing protein [Holophagales bacterium]|nr:LysM peptidoglycan-binding domain-containing protein [Holophagales bacterium]